MNKKLPVMVALSAMLLCSGTAAAEGMANREYLVATTVVVAGDCGAGAAESINVKKGDYFKVVLYGAGGTGYEWTLATANSLLAESVEYSAAPVEGAENLAGGMVRWVFYLKVKPDASGQETLRFVLRRSWEKNVQPARSFDLKLMAR